MKTLFTSLAFVIAFCSLEHSLTADIIEFYDFEGAGDTAIATGFSGPAGNNVDITVDPNASGSNGSEVVSFAINSVSGNPQFSGGILGGLDLGNDPLITVGNITAADLDRFTFSFDLEVAGLVPNLIRIEPLGGGFNERVELNVAPTAGGFQNFSRVLGDLDENQISTLVSTLNSQNSTEIQLVFAYDGQNLTGNTISFDNLTLSVPSSVPEPSSFCLVLGAMALAMKRRRSSI